MKTGAHVKGKIDADLLRQSILWAWTRKKEDYVYGRSSINAVIGQSKVLIDKYKLSEIPLVVNDIQDKIIRIGFSIATLFHSTDKDHEKVILKPIHIRLAGKFLMELYDHSNCRFDQYVKMKKLNSVLTDKEYKIIKKDLLTPGSNRFNIIATKEIFEAYLLDSHYTKQDLMDMTGLCKEAIGGRIKQLRDYRLILTKGRGYSKTARFINFLDRWEKEKAKSKSVKKKKKSKKGKKK